MCILFIAVNQHDDYPLIIAANRDEFHARPTASSEYWQTQPELLAGKDLKAGGTWMGVTRNGKVAALTNVRDPKTLRDDARSRGELATQFLLGNDDHFTVAARLQASRADYNGYNFLYGDWHNLHVYNNHLNETRHLSDGVHGLSNASLNAPWPKVTQGMRELTEYCQNGHDIEEEALFSILACDKKAEDHSLPNTGVPYEWEKQLSSIFIQGEDYGTRCSTLLLVDKQRKVSWTERSFSPAGEVIGQKHFDFIIE